MTGKRLRAWVVELTIDGSVMPAFVKAESRKAAKDAAERENPTATRVYGAYTVAEWRQLSPTPDAVDAAERRQLLEQLAWENGGDLSNAPNDLEPFMLWQPVWLGGFWRELSNYSDEELRARIPREVLEAEGL